MLLIGESRWTGDAAPAPATLVDGTPARPPPVKLEAVDVPAVLTRVRISRGDDASERSASCRERWSHALHPLAVERTGAHVESVTLREASGRAFLACDDARGPREDESPWCGGAYGLLHEGRLQDPRLDVLCSTEEGVALGIAWISPAGNARFVALHEPGYVEVYEVVGGFPVRVSTTDVDLERSSARFEISEHTVAGRLLRRYSVDAVVAG